MDKLEYNQAQLERVTANDFSGTFTLKIIGDGATNWLSITPEQFQKIKGVLCAKTSKQ